MRKKTLGAVLLVAVALGAWARGRGFDTRSEPGRVETVVATVLRHWTVPARYKTMPNPVACGASELDAARAHWADHCAVCHANNGSGETMLGRGMYPKPPDMLQARTQSQTDGELYYTVKNGVPLTGMPAFGTPGDSDNETWALVCLVRHLPSLTADEELAMRALNPKTDADREEERQEAEFLNGGPTAPAAKPVHHHH